MFEQSDFVVCYEVGSTLKFCCTTGFGYVWIVTQKQDYIKQQAAQIKQRGTAARDYVIMFCLQQVVHHSSIINTHPVKGVSFTRLQNPRACKFKDKKKLVGRSRCAGVGG